MTRAYTERFIQQQHNRRCVTVRRTQLHQSRHMEEADMPTVEDDWTTYT